MSQRIGFLLIVLSLSVYSCAQQGSVEHGWTDKNNPEMYAAYMLRNAYYEQGYWEAKVEIRQTGTKRVFVVEPGRIYHVKRFACSLRNLHQSSGRRTRRARRRRRRWGLGGGVEGPGLRNCTAGRRKKNRIRQPEISNRGARLYFTAERQADRFCACTSVDATLAVLTIAL